MTADARRIISEFHEKAGVGYDPENTDESFVARVQRLMATELAALRSASHRQETEGEYVAKLEAALGPFAALGDMYNPSRSDDEAVYRVGCAGKVVATVGDLRRCSAALAARGKGGS